MKANWKWVAAASVVGFVLLSVGFFFSSGTDEAISSIAIELGAGVAMVSVIVWLERQFLRESVRNVAGAEARAVARETVANTEMRITRLEELAELERDLRTQKRFEQESRLSGLFSDGFTAESLGNALLLGIRESLLSDDFGLRTGLPPHSPVLHTCVMAHRDEVQVVFIGFEAFRISGRTMDVDGQQIPVPDDSPSVVWTSSEPPQDLYLELVGLLNRANTPSDSFSLAHAGNQLKRSLEIATIAREAPGGSPQRLAGKLRLLINDDWALTTHGLEQVNGDATFPAEILFGDPHVEIADDQIADDPSLAEAVQILDTSGLVTVLVHDQRKRERSNIANKLRDLN